MYRFWETVIEPLLEVVHPESIVEIGSEYGKNTKNILKYCQKTGAVLYTIDPSPKFDVEEWKEEYGNYFIFYRSLSLNALPLIPDIDVVLIDGDHNWYTVYHELKLLEKQAIQKQKNFPLVMLHDVGWPYARRDLYYNPENIPLAYLKPYKKMGLHPDTPELVENGGINSHLCNSIYENNLQCGVLTAVEDFMEDTSFSLDIFKLPAFHGFGILYPAELKQNTSFKNLVDGFSSSGHLIKLVEQLEESRNRLQVESQELKNNVKSKEEHYQEKVKKIEEELETNKRSLKEIESGYKKEISNYEKEVEKLKQEVDNKERSLKEIEEARRAEAEKYEQQIEGFKEKERTLEAKVENLKQEIEEVRRAEAEKYERQIEGFKEKERTLEAKVENLKQEITEHERTIKEIKDSWKFDKENLEKDLETKENELEDYKRKFKEKEASLGALQESLKSEQKEKEKLIQELEKSNKKIKEQEQIISRFDNWMKDLQHYYRSLLNSKRWRIGNKAVNIFNKLLLRKKKPLVTKKMDKIFHQYRGWRENKNKKKENIPGEVKKLKSWVEELQWSMGRMIESRRWKTGNFLGWISSFLRRNEREPSVVVKLNRVFREINDWEPDPENKDRDIEMLCNWIEEVRQLYKAFLKTRRWRTGNKIISTLNRLVLKKPVPMATKRIEKVFNKYDEWKREKSRKEDNDYFMEAVDTITVAPEEAEGEPYELLSPLK